MKKKETYIYSHRNADTYIFIWFHLVFLRASSNSIDFKWFVEKFTVLKVEKKQQQQQSEITEKHQQHQSIHTRIHTRTIIEWKKRTPKPTESETQKSKNSYAKTENNNRTQIPQQKFWSLFYMQVHVSVLKVYKIRDIEWIRCMNGIARQDDDNNNSNKIRDI